MFRYGSSTPAAGPAFIGSLTGRETTLEGVVVAEPDARLGNVKLTLGELRDRSNRMLDGKLLATTRLYPEYRYGDVLSVRCKLEQPEPFNGFAYDRYLARSDIYALCYYPAITVVERGPPSSVQGGLRRAGRGHPLRAAIYSFKATLQRAINRGLAEPSASLLSAIILGSRRGLPPELVDAFNATGLTHLIAISGAQITLVVGLLVALLPYLGVHRRVGFYLTTAALVAYLTLIGAPASAVRAGIMGWLLQFAYHVGRAAQAWRLLLYAAVAMVALNPKILRDDVGFQLSVAAVAGLIYLQPVLERVLRWVPEAKGLRVALAMTLAANVFTLPLVSAQFGRVSVVSPLANLLVFPIPAFAMMAGAAALVPAMVLPAGFAWAVFLPVHLPLQFLVAVAETMARWPISVLTLQLPALLLLPSYLGLSWLTRWLKRWLEERERYRVGNS